METAQRRPRLPLTAVDRWLVAIHAVTAATFGIVAWLDITDPDWGGLQRVVVMMMVGLWAGGIVASVVIAGIVRSRWLRSAVLLAGPFVGLAVFFGRSALGWG